MDPFIALTSSQMSPATFLTFLTPALAMPLVLDTSLADIPMPGVIAVETGWSAPWPGYMDRAARKRSLHSPNVTLISVRVCC